MTITAPEGSLLNAVRPAPVASRHLIGLFLPDAVMGALAQAVPDRVIAESSSILWTLDVRGRDRSGHVFKEFMATGGGMGARPTKDGLNATQFPSTIRGVPADLWLRLKTGERMQWDTYRKFINDLCLSQGTRARASKRNAHSGTDRAATKTLCAARSRCNIEEKLRRSPHQSA